MFASTSRYAVIPDLTYTGPDGVPVVYKARRFAPRPSSLRLRTIATVAQGERLDLVTARTLEQPELYWRIADANAAMDPFALVAVPGRKLRVPAPQVEQALPSLED